MFANLTKLDFMHIPYRGGAAAQMDIMAGNIEASFQNFGTVVPYIRSGKMNVRVKNSYNRWGAAHCVWVWVCVCFSKVHGGTCIPHETREPAKRIRCGAPPSACDPLVH
jgi:hypothetical protein